MKYAKTGLAVLATVLTAVIAAMTGDGIISNVEWINIAIAGVGACAVFAAPNVPGAMYTKTIIAVLSAVLAFLASAITDGISTAEWLQIGVIALGALSVFAVPNSTQEARSAGANRMGAILVLVGCLFFTQLACGPPSRKTLIMLQSAGASARSILNLNASLPEQLLSEHLIDQAKYEVLRKAYDEFSAGVVEIDVGLTAAAVSEKPSLKTLVPIIADTIGRLRNLRSLVNLEKAQKVLGAIQLSLQVIGVYFALRIAEARRAGYSDQQIAVNVGLPYDRRRFELLASGV